MSKIGMNKGRPRLWLEGKQLTEHGFIKGKKFTISYLPDSMKALKFLKLLIDNDGSRTVSGTSDRPIIDIIGKAVEAGNFKAGDETKIYFSRNVIVVQFP